jgi:hypothetical protein
MNLHSLASSVISSPFKGFTERQNNLDVLGQSLTYAHPVASVLVLFACGCFELNRVQTLVALIMTKLAGHKLERRSKLDRVVQGAVERAAHRVNSVHALYCCPDLFRRH